MGLWKNNVHFVLVEPKEAGNIGTAARAMKNMGFRHLDLVKPADYLNSEGRAFACNAGDILEKAKIYPDLKQAISGKTVVIGTTRRLGKRRGLILTLEESVKKIISLANKNKIAVLFGREDKGLNNKEIESCGFLVTIPADASSLSLNLAQSVLLVAYELSKHTYKSSLPKLAAQNEIENLYSHIHSTLKLLEYIPRGNRDFESRIMRNVKHLIGRSGLTDWELRMLYGTCSQIEKKIR